jgi:hypothetical protein
MVNKMHEIKFIGKMVIKGARAQIAVRDNLAY